MGEHKHEKGNGLDAAAQARIEQAKQETCGECGRIKTLSKGSGDLALLSRPSKTVIAAIEPVIGLAQLFVQAGSGLMSVAVMLEAGHATAGAVQQTEQQLLLIGVQLHDALANLCAGPLKARRQAARPGFPPVGR